MGCVEVQVRSQEDHNKQVPRAGSSGRMQSFHLAFVIRLRLSYADLLFTLCSALLYIVNFLKFRHHDAGSYYDHVRHCTSSRLAYSANSKLQCRQQRKQSQWRLHVSTSDHTIFASADEI